MNPSLDITAEHLVVIQSILQKYLPSHAKVWAYGSRTKNKAKKFSDLDLAIDAGDPLANIILTNIAYDLEESDLPYKVDIVDWAMLSEAFQKRISEDKIRFI